MKNEQFLDLIFSKEIIDKTSIDKKDNNPDDLFFIASRLRESSCKSLLEAFCYAKGFGVEKDLNKFEETLLNATKYGDFRVHLWLVRAYQGFLSLDNEIIKIDDKDNNCQRINDLLNPMLASYYNAKHGYKSVKQIKTEEEAKRKIELEKERLSNEIKEEKEQLKAALQKADLDQIKALLTSLLAKSAAGMEEVSAALSVVAGVIKNRPYAEDLAYELINQTEGYQCTDHYHYFPVRELLEVELYHLAFKLATLCEDEDCSFNTPGGVYLLEGICLYHLERYDEALVKFSLACREDEDCWEEADKYTQLIYEKRKK